MTVPARTRALSIDWVLWAAATCISVLGLVTMHAFGTADAFFERQVIWIIVAQILFFTASTLDYRFLRHGIPVTIIYGIAVVTLSAMLLFGAVTKGAQSWFHLGFFAIQPSDPAKLALIFILAKYFARRHIEIAHIKHILTSGAYAFLLFALVFLQPDFGSAIILAAIWFGMVLISGISYRHLAVVLVTALIAGGGLWLFVLHDYQKQRILTFIHPLADIQGSGYNAYQSTVAVGSGEVFGKGIGYGTQSKLQFLPEYETDFIFAAYAEEWGFVGILFLFSLFGIVLWRIVAIALHGATNLESLVAAGVGVLFLAHFIVHVGMNMGLLPVTGTTIPFMSYGGSHLVTEFTALGILMGMRKYARSVHRESEQKEFQGISTVHL
jgi:rod shape determining protein RodA